MSSIAPATSSASPVVSLLGKDAADGASLPTLTGSNSDTTPGNDRGPATNVVLSDEVKSILARATADQDIADRLKAFVEAQRPDGADNSSNGSDDSKPDAKRHNVNETFERLTAGSQATDSADDVVPVEAAHDFSNGTQFEGYTLSVAARAKDGSFRTELIGPDGLSFFDFRFGHSGEATGFGGPKPGISAASYQRGNVEYITLTENDAAALSSTVATDTGTVSTDAVAAHSSRITFAIDFTTGAIQATKSDALIASASTSVSRLA
jgi:hypothetical protein